MSDVKRWDCMMGATVRETAEGEFVTYEDYAALEAELAKLRAGQEPVAFYWQDVGYKNPNRHGPYFGWPTEAALRNVDGGAIPVPLYTTPQPSAGVVMPGRKQRPYGFTHMPSHYEGWNACLDEFARLNGKEVGRG